MANDVTKRVHYFDHQFLRVGEFDDEQKYHLDRRRRHNRLLHTPGVAGDPATDLVVTGTATARTVDVSPGTAIDTEGREIVLVAQQTLPMPSGPTKVEIYIAYSEVESDPTTDPGVTGNMRTTEIPAFTIRRILPGPSDPVPVGGVLLAEIGLDGAGGLTGGAGNPNNGVQPRAAAVLDNDITASSLTLKRSGVPSTQWPKLSCSQANQAALENSNLKIDAGREIFFQDTGQIRSFDDFHRLVFNRPGNLLELHEFGDIRFLTGGAPPTEKMRILGTGNVGIGTATPTQKLEVSGTVKAIAFEGDGTNITGIVATDNTKVAKAGDAMTGPLAITPAGGEALPWPSYAGCLSRW